VIPFRVVVRNLSRHKLRSLLTAAILAVAIFLLASLHSVLRALDATVEEAGNDRAVVQSAVSLFVDLPLSYQEDIESVDGVARCGKLQWFGGYYRDPANFFAQFAVDAEAALDLYPELEITAGSREEFLTGRTACLVGEGLMNQFGWEVGDSVPLIGTIFTRTDGEPWTFEIAAAYVPTKPAFDARTLFFHFEYLKESLDSGAARGPRGCGTYVLRLDPGVSPAAVMAEIDALFEKGPQRTQTIPESAFSAQFVSMWGNVPMFVSSIGGGVLLAVLLACINTMLLAARQQTRDVGVMKALGFSNGAMGGTLLAQSLLLAILGGGMGLGFAWLILATLGRGVQSFIPGLHLRPETVVLGAILTLIVGLLAGIVPAWRASRMRPVDALRSEE